MPKFYTYQLVIEVTNPEGLYEAAKANLATERKMSPATVRRLIGTKKEPDTDACIRVLYGFRRTSAFLYAAEETFDLLNVTEAPSGT